MHCNYCKKIQIYWNFKVKVLEYVHMYMIIGLLFNKNPIAQSICTYYFWFENMDRFVTLEKKIRNMGCKKQGAKKQGHCYSKRQPLLCIIEATLSCSCQDRKWRQYFSYFCPSIFAACSKKSPLSIAAISS